MDGVVETILKGKVAILANVSEVGGVDVDGGCPGLGILDVPYHHHCFNLSDPGTKAQCDIEYPCEVRQFLYSMSGFIYVTSGFLSYGTVIIIVLGLFLNSLSFYTLVSSGLSKSGSGIYLLSLAVCDSGNLVANYALGVSRGHIIQFNQYFMDDEWLCRLHGVFVDVFQLISAWIVVCFTVERSVAIWYPMLLRNKSRKKRARVVVFSLATVLTLFSLTKLFLTGFEGDSVFGYPACFSRRYRWEGVSYVRIAFQTWIPTVMVFVFNLLMFCKLQRIKQHRKQLTKYKRPGLRGEGSRKPSFINRPSPTAPMLIAVSLTYLVLVFPLGIVQTTELVWNIHNKPPLYPGVGTQLEIARKQYVQWKTTKLLLKYIRSFCFGFYQMNFAINFFLYFATGLQFRLHLQHKINLFFKRFGIETCIGGLPSKEESQDLASATGSTAIHSRNNSLRRSYSRGSTLRSSYSQKERRTESITEEHDNSAMIAATEIELVTFNATETEEDNSIQRSNSSDSDSGDEEKNEVPNIKRVSIEHQADSSNLSSSPNIPAHSNIPTSTSVSSPQCRRQSDSYLVSPEKRNGTIHSSSIADSPSCKQMQSSDNESCRRSPPTHQHHSPPPRHPHSPPQPHISPPRRYHSPPRHYSPPSHLHYYHPSSPSHSCSPSNFSPPAYQENYSP